MGLSDDPEVRRRQLAAIFAKQKGTYTGSGYRGKKISSFTNIVNTTAKGIAIGVGIGATATVFPAIVPIYKVYSIARIGKEMYDAYNKSKNKDEIFDKTLLGSIRYNVSEASGKLSKGKVSQIAKGVRLATETAGIINKISRKTKIDEKVYSSMLEGSVRNGMLFGIENFASYTVESFVGG